MRPVAFPATSSGAQGPQQGSNPLSGLGNLIGGGAQGIGGLSGGGGLSSFGPAFWAALIGLGKNLESNHPTSGLGETLRSLLGPDINQVAKDPIGEGLPTLFGFPFLTPWTASKASKEAKPEWEQLFSLGSNF